MMRLGVLSISVIVLLSGCAALLGGSNRQVLFGSSFASTDEAVQELNLAVSRTEASHGCSLISVGGGTGLGAGERRGGKQIDVYGVIQCPAGTPNSSCIRAPA